MANSVFTREDTLFGVCFALGADFGFNPTWLRALFACLFFWSPAAAAAVYAAGGVVVALSRWIVPEPADAQAELAEPDELTRDERPEDLRLAA